MFTQPEKAVLVAISQVKINEAQTGEYDEVLEMVSG